MADCLFLERECEHGRVEVHPFDPPRKTYCHDGERREVVVDYEAAVKVINGDGDDGMWGLSEIEPSLVRAAIDAALGLEDR